MKNRDAKVCFVWNSLEAVAKGDSWSPIQFLNNKATKHKQMKRPWNPSSSTKISSNRMNIRKHLFQKFWWNFVWSSTFERFSAAKLVSSWSINPSDARCWILHCNMKDFSGTESATWVPTGSQNPPHKQLYSFTISWQFDQYYKIWKQWAAKMNAKCGVPSCFCNIKFRFLEN